MTDKETHIALLKSMLRIRLFEERIVELYPEQEMRCPVHLCIGQEAIAAGVSIHLETEDYVFSNHRGHGHAIAKGSEMALLMAEFYGKATGCSKGKGGSMHIIDVENGMLGTSAIVGGGIPMGVGAALASNIKKDGRVTVIYFGDGAADEGVFYESMNFASLKKLPVVFVLENNYYATNSHQRARHPTCEISSSAGPSFSMPSRCIDGNDVLAVYDAAKEAVEFARAGKGPSLIEATTYRWKGHVGPEADFEKGCRPEEELIDWMKKCPVKRTTETLLKENIMTTSEIETLKSEINSEIDKAVEFAKKSPYPNVEELTTEVYYVNKETS